jgi:hypothetical protein
MKKSLACVALAIGAQAHAAVTCDGTVSAVYKWDTATTLSVRIALSNGTVLPWIALPGKPEEGLALTAFATGKPVQVYWSPADVTACTSGAWADNRVLQGFILLTN